MTGVVPFRFSTDALPAATRMAFVRDGYARLAMAVDLEPLCDEPAFRLDLTTFQLNANVGLGGGLLSPYVGRRSRALAARAGIDAVLVTRFSQPFRFTGGPLAGEAFEPGDTLFAPMDEAFEYVYPAGGVIQTVWVQRAALRALLPRLDSGARHIGPSPHMNLLFGYADVAQREASFSQPLADLTASHVTELLALALGAHGDAAEQARAGGARAARLAALRADAARHYRDPQLTVAHVAARHGLSVRQVQRLFEEDGTTFTAHVQSCRLAHVQRRLIDPRHAHELVATLAYDAGFSDLAAFNRLFKQRFGVTPSQLREAALLDRR